MRSYEGVFILDPDLGSEVSKNTVAQIQELVTKNGGRVDGLQEWGRRRLAYKIKKKQDGHYILLHFQLDPLQAKKMEQTLRLNDQLLKFLLVRKDRA
ncbi:MAG: 30S ribosomal protein S6 [Candidatus Omnitrophica bacterium]|nr:30S ribosomal protein S6 [Candidatus Omnitrophota bacterium]